MLHTADLPLLEQPRGRFLLAANDDEVKAFEDLLGYVHCSFVLFNLSSSIALRYFCINTRTLGWLQPVQCGCVASSVVEMNVETVWLVPRDAFQQHCSYFGAT